MSFMSIFPYEEHTKTYLPKEPSLLLAELFPRLSRPNKSRFLEFFETESKKISSQTNNLTPPLEKSSSKKSKKNKKRSMDLNLLKILNGADKRTSLMIKNIPISAKETDVLQWLSSLAKLNYIYVPKDQQSNQILGFAFINVCKYTDILDLIRNVKKYQKVNFNIKKIAICYSHKQGFKLLTKSFGNSSIL